MFTMIALFGTSMMSTSSDDDHKTGVNGANEVLIEKVDEGEA